MVLPHDGEHHNKCFVLRMAAGLKHGLLSGGFNLAEFPFCGLTGRLVNTGGTQTTGGSGGSAQDLLELLIMRLKLQALAAYLCAE
jgi:hypothetical protein